MIDQLTSLPDHGFEILMGYMSAAEDEYTPDGAWWAILEDAAQMFAEDEGITIDTNEAVQQYIKWKKR